MKTTPARAAAEAAWQHQRPAAGTLTLDHTAHFVPDIEAASRAVERLGFVLTPFSAQQHRIEPGAPLTPAGSGNRCVMLGEGYLEILTPTADTPVARRMRAAMERYTGLHLICFGTAEAPRMHRHLMEGGFAPQPPVALERRIGTEAGEGTARFTVLRVPPEAMPEGRIQIVEHHTPELLWQARWLEHPNLAAGLAAAIVCTADPEEAGSRFARFAGAKFRSTGRAGIVEGISRGAIMILDPSTLKDRFGVEPPTLPWIAGVEIHTGDLDVTRAHLRRNGFEIIALKGREAIAVAAPQAIGGLFIFSAPGAGLAG